ncbi:hypothetical protein AB4Z52_21940 [Rhizobium sp. 2YAF20]|uniref:hypothetical protein n=1 Tax=Rhizobium sp. 2YAF20 TaxID=3233027 RepID=UPI003F9CD99E
MGTITPKDGTPGTTDQTPRWEGPQKYTPPGYMPAKDNPDTARDANGESGREVVGLVEVDVVDVGARR